MIGVLKQRKRVGTKRRALRLRRFPWLPMLVLVALAAASIAPALAGGIFLPLDIVPHYHPWRFSYERVPVNNPLLSDIVLQIYPRRVLANALVRQGAWPLWDPTILTGTPLLADGQLLLFYPPSLLWLLLPLRYAFGIYALSQIILAALGTYLFARRIALTRAAATVAGVCYMFSGFMLTRLSYPEHAAGVAMLPWCFWATAQACESHVLKRWLLAGCIFALALVVHIQLAFYAFVGAGCLFLLYLFHAPNWTARRRLAGGYALALLIAFALSAVQLLPEVELSSVGQRWEQVPNTATAESQFLYLLRLVLPASGGAPRTPPPVWGPSLLQLPQPYAGFAPLLLVVVALLLSRHPASPLLAALAIGSFALAIGTPLLQLLIALVPPYRQFGDHTRWFVLWGFAVAALAGMGVDRLVVQQRRPARAEQRVRIANWLLLGGTALILGVWLWRHLALFTPASRYGAYITLIRQQPLSIPLLIILASIVALAALPIRRLPLTARWLALALVVALDTLWYGGGYNTVVSPALFRPTADLKRELPASAAHTDPDQDLFPPTRQIAFLQRQPRPFRFIAGDYAALAPNFASVYGLEDARGYLSLYLERYSRLVRLIDGKDYTRLAGQGSASYKSYLTTAYRHQRLLDMLNVQYVVFPPGSKTPELYHGLVKVQQNDEGTIYRNPNVLPRAWLVHAVDVIPDEGRQLDRLARADFDPARVAIVPQTVPAVSATPRAEAAPAVSYAPNAVEVRALAEAPAVLVLSDAYASGWQALVDGRPATLLRTNYALRGVWVPAGQHTVRFIYQPRSFLIGGLVSAITLCGLLLAGLGTGWRRNRHRDGEAAFQPLPE